METGRNDRVETTEEEESCIDFATGLTFDPSNNFMALVRSLTVNKIK